jgi:tetratricopeptide (TPR) repeat protein
MIAKPGFSKLVGLGIEHEFRTARPSRPVYCHQEFLDKLASRHNDPVAKRASLLLQRMAVDIARLHYKSTSGLNRGWRRSRLGGSSGSHFYAWWAPAGAAPVKQDGAFNEHEAIFLRDIRHHDDHAPLTSGSLADDYLRMSVPDLRGTEYAPDPWTQQQLKFAKSRGVARVLKGHPGSGKTTALLHAADISQAERVLYLTFSNELAVMARDYFDRFCSGARTFTVLTYPVFLRQLIGANEFETDATAGRSRFRRDLQNFQRTLGAWGNDTEALYDEMHAHLVGAAVPETSGRFAKAERIRLPEQAYRNQRNRYIIGQAIDCVIETANRLEKAGEGPLADRYFPELALAWRAAHTIVSGVQGIAPAFLNYGCIAVDEVQDLTPLEAYVAIALSRQLNRARYSPLLLAGDEAQTVRPTDFEWAWLNDMLHSALGAPQEFKLSINLRSPRRLADIVNRVWDYYGHLRKQDRPSGSGYADIDDDSPDQVLYAAIPPADLPPLLLELSQREGLAMIAFDKSGLPRESLPFILSPAEAKGLDFQSVCVLNGGALINKVADERGVGIASEPLAKRLAIDQLRVAVSRPTERLLWIDTAPSALMVRQVGHLLRSLNEFSLAPITAEALRACLNEEELEVEERVQLCQRDARQLVPVKPDMAWSRAHQAVSLLGFPGDILAIRDLAARDAAHMTLCEVCFQLAFRKKSLSPELGKPDLYDEAASAARHGRMIILAEAIQAIGRAETAYGADRLDKIGQVVQYISDAKGQLPAWLTVEVMPRAGFWVDELEQSMDAGENALIAQRILPPFFDAIGFPDAQARKDRLAQRAVRILMKNKKHALALQILEKSSDAKSKLAAECYEESDQMAKAAAIYLELGDREKALRCYRSIPDFAASLELVRKIDGHAARASLEWLAELNGLLAKRPENFNRVMVAGEKKLLEGMLERGMGVKRKKPGVKKAAAVKKAPKKKAAPAVKRRGPLPF